MNKTVGLARKCASLGISLLMLAVSLAIPALERSELANGPVFESEHDPAECPTAHDHRICTQVGGNLSAPSMVQEHRLAFKIVSVATPTEATRRVSSGFAEGHPARAPPLT